MEKAFWIHDEDGNRKMRRKPIAGTGIYARAVREVRIGKKVLPRGTRVELVHPQEERNAMIHIMVNGVRGGWCTVDPIDFVFEPTLKTMAA
jgi:hypothetical protein